VRVPCARYSSRLRRVSAVIAPRVRAVALPTCGSTTTLYSPRMRVPGLLTVDHMRMNQEEPGPSANGDAKTGPGLRSIGVRRWLFAMVCAGLALFLLGDRARDFYQYQAGTPATATSIACHSQISQDAAGAHNTYCTGTWGVGGQSQTGPIEPAPNSPISFLDSPGRSRERRDGLHGRISRLGFPLGDSSRPLASGSGLGWSVGR
jgi:hypothetical protein